MNWETCLDEFPSLQEERTHKKGKILRFFILDEELNGDDDMDEGSSPLASFKENLLERAENNELDDGLRMDTKFKWIPSSNLRGRYLSNHHSPFHLAYLEGCVKLWETTVIGPLGIKLC